MIAVLCFFAVVKMKLFRSKDDARDGHSFRVTSNRRSDRARPVCRCDRERRYVTGNRHSLKQRTNHIRTRHRPQRRLPNGTDRETDRIHSEPDQSGGMERRRRGDDSCCAMGMRCECEPNAERERARKKGKRDTQCTARSTRKREKQTRQKYEMTQYSTTTQKLRNCNGTGLHDNKVRVKKRYS